MGELSVIQQFQCNVCEKALKMTKSLRNLLGWCRMRRAKHKAMKKSSALICKAGKACRVRKSEKNCCIF